MVELSFFTAEPISESRSMTPEGFMVCHDVAIARTGTMAYGPGETPVRVNDQGWALIQRNDDEVFRPESMYSMTGKPVTDDHPFYDVTPTNYRDLARGHVVTVRRGTGDKVNLLLADILVTDNALIQKIRDGKCEVSCGYVANYVEDGVGRGRQTNIRYNHLAVVDKGRCGERCRIGDAAYAVGVVGNRHPAPGGHTEELMARSTKVKALDGTALGRLRAELPLAAQVSFDAALAKLTKDAEDESERDGDKSRNDVSGHTINIHNHPSEERMSDTDEDDEDDERKKRTEDRIVKRTADAVLAALKAGGLKFKDVGEGPNVEAEPDATNKELDNELQMEVPQGAQHMSQDAQLGAIVRDTAALANAMAPGIRIPTLDAASAADPRRVLDAVCGLRRAALKVALGRAETAVLAGSLVRDAATIDAMKCGDLRAGFRAVGESARAAATRDAAPTGIVGLMRPSTGAGLGVGGEIKTAADFNKFARAYYKKSA